MDTQTFERVMVQLLQQAGRAVERGVALAPDAAVFAGQYLQLLAAGQLARSTVFAVICGVAAACFLRFSAKSYKEFREADICDEDPSLIAMLISGIIGFVAAIITLASIYDSLNPRLWASVYSPEYALATHLLNMTGAR